MTDRRRAAGRRAIRLRLAGAVVSLLLAPARAAAGEAEPWEGLQALPRVAVEVSLVAGPPELGAAELERRIEAALREGRPAPRLDPASAERLRLAVAVRPYRASELRGFYLPFSGTYGIGAVRLSVERPAVIAGLPTPVRVTAWQAERQAGGPWRRSAVGILNLVDELLAAFFESYRRAVGP